MTDTQDRNFSSDFRRFFGRGLVVLLPSVITLWLVVAAYNFVHTKIASPINDGIKIGLINLARVWEPLQRAFDPTEEELRLERTRIASIGGATILISTDAEALPDERLRIAVSPGTVITIKPDDETAQEERLRIAPGSGALDERAFRSRLRSERILAWWDEWWILDAIGLLVAIIGVYIAGRFLGGFVGRRIYRRLEAVITTLPVFKQVYPYVKQVVDFLFSDDQPVKFNRVVAAEYPRRGIWSIGFLTNESFTSMRTLEPEAMVSIFIPSSPTPFTGYTINIPRTDVVELPFSVDEAIRFAVSGGVLVPPSRPGAIPKPLATFPGTPTATPGTPGTPGTPAAGSPVPDTAAAAVERRAAEASGSDEPTPAKNLPARAPRPTRSKGGNPDGRSGPPHKGAL